MFKKTAIAALVVGFSSAASAAMYAPAPAPACSAGNVTVPCEKNAWDIGIDALYLRNQYSQFSSVDEFRAKYGWGFRAEGSYHFGTGNDATVSWAHYNKGTGPRQSRMLRSKLNLVNFEVGQQVDLGENVDLRLQGGVQFARLTDDGIGGATAGLNIRTKGWGPRIGSNVAYDFGNGFNVFAAGNFALLMAKVNDFTGNNKYYSSALNTDEAIGVAYMHAMAQGDLTARLAWTAMQLDASGTTGSSSWTGFSLGLKWIGNA